ncbi:MAG: YciI family protein [Cyanobacteria bacterium J06628_3]
MPWFVKIEEGKVDKTTFDKHVPAHKAYVEDLKKKGHEAKTGYWAQYGGGMLLFKAASMDEAQAIVARDPLIENNCVDYKLYEWRLIVD